MFRESDYQSPRLHPSYGNQPIPVLQQVAQKSSFINPREEINNLQILPEPEIIPTTWDTIYDPQNPG